MIKPTIAIIIALAGIASAHADDHVIRPQCWEENVNGQVQRHCEVKRADAPKPAQQPPARRPLYDTDQPVPPPAAAAPPTH
jgi:hypothetical protein